MKTPQYLLTLVLLFTTYHASAQTRAIYVSPKGESGALGDESHPLQTIDEALIRSEQISGKDTLYIKVASGNYYLDKPLTWTKSPTHPLVIEGYGQEKPLLSGGITISNWEETPQGWWRCTVPEVVHYGITFEQLYVNGKRATRARTPDTKWFFITQSSENVAYRGSGRVPVYATQKLETAPSTLQSLKEIDWEDTNISALFYHKWDNTRKRIDYAQADSGFLFIHGTGMKPWNKITKGSRYILENYKEALTAPGEWYLDNNGQLFYIPRPGETIATATCHAPMLRHLVEINGNRHHKIKGITLRNLSFAHATHPMPIRGNEPEQAAANIDAAIMMNYATDCHIENCEIQHTGNYAIWLKEDCSDCIIRHNYIHDLGAGGIKIGNTVQHGDTLPYTHDILVENNIISHTGMVYPCGVGIAIFHAHDNKVMHNDLFDLRYSAISVGWVWGYAPSPAHHNEVGYNNIHHVGWGELSDMGAIYTLGISPGTRIHNNVIHDVYAYDYGGWGLYTDEGSSHITMDNNLVYACKSGSFHQHYGKHNLIKNNIFASSIFYQARLTKYSDEEVPLSFENNILYADHAALLSGLWAECNVKMSRNCYWSTQKIDTFKIQKKPRTVYETIPMKKWTKMKDKHSIIANPYFKSPETGDFSFKSMRTARRIRFKPFDTSVVGVYGDKLWRDKAIMSPEKREAFRQIVIQKEKTHSAYFDHVIH